MAEQDLAMDVFTNLTYEKVNKGRTELSQEMVEESKNLMPQYGIELIDILVRQIKYSDDLTESVYNRMIKERNQIAQAFRSDGEGRKAALFGEMDKEVRAIESGAYRSAETIKGTADARAAAIYAAAYTRNPEFYEFWKAMDTLRTSLDSGSTVILSTDSELLRYLKESKAGR